MNQVLVPLADAEVADIETVLREAWQRAASGEFGTECGVLLLSITLRPGPSGRLLIAGNEAALRELLGFCLIDTHTPITTASVNVAFRIGLATGDFPGSGGDVSAWRKPPQRVRRRPRSRDTTNRAPGAPTSH